MHLVPPSDLVRPLAISVLIVTLFWAIGGLILRDGVKGALFASFVWILLMIYSWIPGLVAFGAEIPSFLWFYLGSILLLSWFLAKIASKGTQVLNVFGLVIFSFILFGTVRVVASPARAAPGKEVPNLVRQDSAKRPDIFYIIVDGYGRPDVLREKMGLDLSWFEKALRDKGFVTLEKSHSNYVQTELSIASSLNLGYLDTLLTKEEVLGQERSVLQPMLDQPFVASKLQARGYEFLSVTSGFPLLKFRGSQSVGNRQRGLTFLESGLLDLTPLRTQGFVASSQFDVRRERLAGALDNLMELAKPSVKPRFIVAHILAPHPPFVLDADGNEIRPAGPFGYWDGSDFVDRVGPKEDYRKGYSGQVAYLSKRLIPILDEILQRSNGQAIIIVQGDHGSKMGLDQNSLEQTDLTEAFSILNAIHLPRQLAERVAPDMTPVNSFRLILSELFGEDLPPLPNRSFYSTYPQPFRFEEVTHQLDSKKIPPQ
ncbi:MAG: LTA synthase family protein [Fimbriimonadaceae bacterium]|nr:LTA synthase family protein [Fimbriimonadaceae bacterium]